MRMASSKPGQTRAYWSPMPPGLSSTRFESPSSLPPGLGYVELVRLLVRQQALAYQLPWQPSQRAGVAAGLRRQLGDLVTPTALCSKTVMSPPRRCARASGGRSVHGDLRSPAAHSRPFWISRTIELPVSDLHCIRRGCANRPRAHHPTRRSLAPHAQRQAPGWQVVICSTYTARGGAG